MKKLKVLMLGTTDSKLVGHIQDSFLKMPDYVDAKMVTMQGLYGKNPHCFIYANENNLTFWEKLRLIRFTLSYRRFWRVVYCLFKLRVIPIINRQKIEHYFYGWEFTPYTAKDILKKCPHGYVPDLITIHWSSGFITSKIVRELHEITNAPIAYIFVDEAPMTGGCHYPVNCKNYMNGCHACPALSHGKKLAAIQMKYKEDNLKGIPMYICGSPYDMRLAKKTKLFKNATVIPSIANPHVTITDRQIARKKLGLNNDWFIVMIGANLVTDIRKGIGYSIESINLAAKKNPNLAVLIVGSDSSALSDKIKNTKVVELGYVSLDKLFLAFSASNCFLSTTIADSGPMMVNYSMAIGTPVISFPIGIAEDLVVHKKTGYLAEYKNIDDLKDGILFLSGMDSKSQKQMSDDCIKQMKEKATSWIQYLLNFNENSIAL